MTTEPKPQLPDEGEAGIAAMVADGLDQSINFVAAGAASDPLPGNALDGIQCGKWVPDELGLPPDCPVLPLGMNNGEFYFLNTTGEMRVLTDSKFSQNTINALFAGRHHYLYWAWPQYNKNMSRVTGFMANKARESLMQACACKPVFDPVLHTRGRGAWLGPDNGLILHCGDRLITDGHTHELGEIGGFVYPTRPPIQKPWVHKLTDKPGPALELLQLLQSWRWERPEVDPILLLGWIAAAMVGGALQFRPSVFIVGDKATGKSTLQQIVQALYSDALIHTADTTEAGISQLLKYDSLPVAIDEFEGKADNRRNKSILDLARAAFSGDLRLRGGDNHKGTQFNARSSFLFSAINTPPLDPSDMSRQAILLLKRFPQDATPPTINTKRFNNLGRMILRRMVDNWHRFPATLQSYYGVLADAGHGGRGQNTFGTLLACADMVLDVDAETLGIEMAQNAPDSKDMAVWGDRLRPEDMFEFEGVEENWRHCLNHVLSARIDAWRGGGRGTVGKILSDYQDGIKHNVEGAPSFDSARRSMQETGLSLQRPTLKTGEVTLFVPNQNPLLHELFKGTKWAGHVDAGGWSVALRQCPDELYTLAQGRINGVHSKGTAFVLKDILGTDDDESADDDSQDRNTSGYPLDSH